MTHAHRHRDLAYRFRQLHKRQQHLGRGLFRAHHFQQFHHVGGAEKVRAHHLLRAARCRRYGVHIQVGGIGGQDAVGLTGGVQCTEYLLLDRHILEHRLDDKVNPGDIRILGGAGDVGEYGVDLLLAVAPAPDRTVVVLAHDSQAPIEVFPAGFHQGYRYPGTGETHGNTATHGARADDCYRFDRRRPGVRGDTGQFGAGALGKEHMPQGGRLGRVAALDKALPLERLAPVDIVPAGEFHQLDNVAWRDQAAGFAGDGGAVIIEEIRCEWSG